MIAKISNNRFVKSFKADRWSRGLFWSWNLIFIAFMLLGFAPQILPMMIIGVRTGDIPSSFLLYALTLTGIPVIAVIIGLTLLRPHPGRLFALGFGAEAPLMILIAFRFFLVRQMTPAIAVLLVTASLGLAAFLWHLLDQRIDQRGPLWTHIRLISMTFLLIIGLYAAVWVSFYVVPLVAQSGELLGGFFRGIGRALRELNWSDLVEQWRWIPFMILWMILLLYTGILVAILPVAIALIYGRAWWRSARAMLSAYARPRAVTLTTAAIALFIALLIFSSRQPQHTAFALLETPPTTPAEARALQDQEAVIRKGLLNSYLAPQRYMSTVGGIRHIQEMYQGLVNLNADQSERVRSLYERLIYPFLYQPVHPSAAGSRLRSSPLDIEPAEAAELYEAFFDQTIIDGERDQVVKAVRSTWSVGQARAAWQAVDEREIYLSRQEIAVAEHGDWAEIELHEVYQNQTTQRQEVVYYFSLPESAVITGLWLGASDDRADRFPYRVSPRGAAQTLYRSEVLQRQIDPALVEQIGPRQYRLRVFPVDPQRVTWDNGFISPESVEDGPPLHMWLTYRVMAAGDSWPLPHLAEHRNVYWDDDTQRLLDGQPLAVDPDSWLPGSLPAAAAVEPQTHLLHFPGGRAVLVRPWPQDQLPEINQELHIAAVLDRSRSMLDYAEQVNSALEQLGGLADKVDLYLTASDYLGEPASIIPLADFDPQAIVYMGGQNAAQLLIQFNQLQQERVYDAVFILTDGTGYELDDSGFKVPIPNAPVWMVHLGGDFPLGYDDDTVEAIQASGGGIAGSVQEAISRLALSLSSSAAISAEMGIRTDLVDGYMWMSAPDEVVKTMSSVDPRTAETTDPGMAAFAARRLILADMIAQREQLDATLALSELDTLDQLHQIAIENSIVTPYSSMIVLVEERQQRLLDQLETRSDRFEREYEEIGETAATTITGVPEPEEWLLLILVVGMLAWYWYTGRQHRLLPHRP